MPMHIGEAEVAPGAPEGELLVIEAKQPEHRGVQIVNVDLVFGGLKTKLVRGPMHIPAAHPASRVISTIGADIAGQSYNINADTVAGAIAESLRAEKLVYLTNVAGMYGDLADEASLISRIDVDRLAALVDDGVLSEGMIPKARSCVDAVKSGVSRAHILDGRIPHALLLEFFTREGIGTMVVA